jgi:hypothetical protein
LNLAIILPILSLLWAGMRIENREISLSLIDETYDQVINTKDIYQPTEKNPMLYRIMSPGILNYY